MRWLVEVSAVGTTEKESFTVEAESWQKALQQTRSLRRDEGSMSGFSVELLDEGCRAFDPITRMRYVVRREQAGAPVASPPQPVLYKRSHDPTAELPLTYREVVYLMPLGTDERAAEALVRQQLEKIRASLDARAATPHESGRLVRLAVFDRVFQGKPPVPPLVVLTWKDWRGAPDVTYPRRLPEPEVPPPTPTLRFLSAPPPSLYPPPPPSPAVEAVPAAMVEGDAGAEAPLKSSPPSSLLEPPPTARANLPPSPVPARPSPLPGRRPSSSNPPSDPALRPPPVPAFPPLPRPSTPAVVAPAKARPSPLPPKGSSSSAPAQAPRPKESPRPPPPPSTDAKSGEPLLLDLPVVEPSGGVGPRELDAVAERAPASERVDSARRTHPAIRPRLKAEELVAAFFEAMHELHFLRDAVEGADFCLTVVLERLPADVGLLHLYDIDNREFVTVATRGDKASELLLRRYPERDPVIAAAMRRRRAIVHADASKSNAKSIERFAAFGELRSLVTAPVMLAGRFLGAMELVNPSDGAPFTEAEGHALTYVGERLAEFAAARGVITDPERVRAVAGARGRSG